MQRLGQLFKKYKEQILYLFFGVVTTIISLGSFKLFNLAFGEHLYLFNNVLSWVLAVAAAYVTNKLWVFENRSWSGKVLRHEIPTFLGARIFSLVVEEVGLYLMMSVFGWDSWAIPLPGSHVLGGDMICKFIMQVIVVILNYIFSKLVIFKKKA